MFFGKLDNASTYQMGERVVCVVDLAPKVSIVLLPLFNDASLGSVAGNTSKLLLPKAVYRMSTSNELGGQDRTFNGLDRTHREIAVEIEIDGTDLRLFGGRDLFFDFGRTTEGLLDRSMQPPGRATSHQGRTAYHHALW